MSTVKKQLRAGQMSFILIGMMVALLGILIGGSVFAASLISDKSEQATHAQIDADISNSDAGRLEALKQYLAKNATGISQTASLTAGLGSYDQNSIVATLSGYASKSGVAITSFDFGTSATGTPSAAGAAAPASTAGSVNISLGSPVSYQKFVVFLRLIEQGLMPAKIMNAQISGDGENPGNVTVSSLSIQVAQ